MMLSVSLLLPLLAATSTLAADRQVIINRPPPPDNAGPQPYECPPDFACGGSSSNELVDGGSAQVWCQNRVGANCGGNNFIREATYADLRTIVGCEALPINTPLCPVGNCAPTCFCRESFLERLKDLLLGGKGGSQDGSGKRDEL